MDIREAMVLSQGEQYACRAAPLALAAEAAVTNATTGRALPLLKRNKGLKHTSISLKKANRQV